MTAPFPVAAQRPQQTEPKRTRRDSDPGPQVAVQERRFFVCVHDVCPRFEPALRTLLYELERRIGDQFALAVTPKFGGETFAAERWDFVRETQSDLLLHGLTHRRAPNLSPVSVVNGFADEWTGKSANELESEIGEAATEIERLFGRQAIGVTAPCWQWGAFGNAMLERQNLDVAVGYRSAWNARQRVRLATQSWDWGAMSPAAPLLSQWTRWSSSDAPCIVLHPVDCERGHHRKGLRAIDRLLKSGARVSRFGEIFAG